MPLVILFAPLYLLPVFYLPIQAAQCGTACTCSRCGCSRPAETNTAGRVVGFYGQTYTQVEK